MGENNKWRAALNVNLNASGQNGAPTPGFPIIPVLGGRGGNENPTMKRLVSLSHCLIVSLSPAFAAEVPSGFSAETLATQLNAATALAVAPDGRVFIADQTGPLRVWKDGALRPAPALDLTGRVDDYWERGLLGVTLHPDFPHTPHLFVLYVARQPHTHHVLSRFTLRGETADPASEVVLLKGDDQATLGGKQKGGHQGGPLRFGPDGKLYVALGDQTAGEPAQRLDTLQGKILRLNADGGIPADNPFLTQATGKNRAIWALGLRNPFGLAFEPGTGRLLENDVGQSAWEEVNVIERGANYGWPRAEGVSAEAGFQNPLHAYPPLVGRSIAGGAFFPEGQSDNQTRRQGDGSSLPVSLSPRLLAFPPPWRGRYFFADYMAHWVKALDPANPKSVLTFAKNLNGPVALEFAPDGSLLVLNRGTIWRDGKNFAPHSGSLVRIRFTGLTEQIGRAPLPRTLGAAQIFTRLAPLTPRPEFTPFEINHPPWQPGLHARRWLSLPPGKGIAFSAAGEWEFPAGAIVVQHHALESGGTPFETHVLWFTGPRAARAAAYRWTADARDAALVEDGEIIPLPGPPKRHWFSPGAEEALNLDFVITGFLLPLNTRQLHRGDQLAQWNERGWFTPSLSAAQIATLPKLAALADASASLEHRVRSYLDVHCAVCHRPGGPSRGHYDARFATPLAEQKLIHGELMAGDLGVKGARAIVPGHPEKSALHLRLARNDFFRMPPVAVNDEPPPVLPLLAEWIRSLAPAANTPSSKP